MRRHAAQSVVRFRRLVSQLTVLAVAAFVVHAGHAQIATKGPIRIIVGFAAGGSSDVAARLIAENI